jgi:membrane protein YqaA with SNARE-associated domain
LETIRQLIHHFIQWGHAALVNPGLAAFASVFAVAFTDAVVPLPGGMDSIVATAVLATQGEPLYVAAYIVLAALGNAAGNTILYAIGHKGGEVFLEKRLGKEKFNTMRTKFEKREVLTLALAAIMPPPFPFKTLVFSAAVFEVDFHRFLLGIFAGRLLRFSILATLILVFGPQIIGVLRGLLREHLMAMLISLAGILVVLLLLRYLRQARKPAAAKTKANLQGSRSA